MLTPENPVWDFQLLGILYGGGVADFACGADEKNAAWLVSKLKIKGVYFMAKYKNRKALSFMLVLLSVVIAAGFTYAGTAKTLKFNGSATFGPETQPDLYIEFTGTDSVTKVANFTADDPTDESWGKATVIDDGLTGVMDINLLKPGSSVTFKFKVKNAGTMGAKLGTPVFNTPYPAEVLVASTPGTGTYVDMKDVTIAGGAYTTEYTITMQWNPLATSAGATPGKGWTWSFSITIPWDAES